MNKPKLNQPDVEQSTTLEPNTSITLGAYGTPKSKYFENPTSQIPTDLTIEEVKKEWEDDGFKWEENEKFIFIFNRIYSFSIDKEKQRFSCFDVIGNGAMAHFITLEQNIRLTKTFRALKWEV